MIDIQQAFSQAQSAYQQARYDDALQLLQRLIGERPREIAFYHLTGLCQKKQGRFEAARKAFERALAIRNDVAALHAELGSVLDDLGKTGDAIEAYDQAIRLAPGLLEAKIDRALVRARHSGTEAGLDELRALARNHSDSARLWLNIALLAYRTGNHDEAEKAAEQVLRLSPGNPRALKLRAQLALDLGRPAVELFREARRVNPQDRELVSLEAAALLAERRDEEAIALLHAAISEDLEWSDGLQMLSRTLWQAGDEKHFLDCYEKALDAHPNSIQLWSDYIAAIWRSRGHEAALEAVGEGRKKADVGELFDILEANSLCELGQTDRARPLFEKIAHLEEQSVRLPLIRFCLRTGEFERAAELGEELVRKGGGPDAWPYISIAWRVTEDPRWLWLEGERDLPQVFDIEELVDELPQLAARLRQLHRWQVQPLEQTLRGGTQTDNVLFVRQEPEIQSLVRHVESAVARYIDRLPPHDEAHPVLSQPRGAFRFAGSWSVRLTDAGFHVNHIHNRGWISSALYVALPPTMGADEADQDGWLALGEPPVELGLDLPPLKLVQPKPGRLVLFPSIMWHGTRPFSSGERLTVAFDVQAS